MGQLTENTEQAIWNALTSNARLSEQEAVNKYFSTEPYQKYTLQEAMSLSLYGKRMDLTVQEMLWEALRADLAISGPKTKYSEQELLNMAQDAGVAIGRIFLTRYARPFSKTTARDVVTILSSRQNVRAIDVTTAVDVPARLLSPQNSNLADTITAVDVPTVARV